MCWAPAAYPARAEARRGAHEILPYLRPACKPGTIAGVDEQAILQAVVDQWPLVGVLLLMGYRSGHQAVAYAKEIGTKIDSALKEQITHGRRLEEGFAELARVLQAGVAGLKDQTQRHSKEIEALHSGVTQLTGRIEDIERSGGHPIHPRPLAVAAPRREPAPPAD